MATHTKRVLKSAQLYEIDIFMGVPSRRKDTE